MRTARGITGWGAAVVAATLVATASPAAALSIEDTAAPTVETPAPAETSAPEQDPTPEPADSATPTPEPEDSSAPEQDAAPAPQALPADRAERAQIAAAAVGDLAVTVFDDRYADGIFDTSKVARNGEVDTAGRSVRLLTSDGAWHDASPGADGVVRFTAMPVGEAEIHVVYPNGPGDAAFFDATGATSADDIERLPTGRNQFDQATGVATVAIDDDGEARVIGLTGLRAVAEVKLPGGAPAVGASVEFGSAGQWYPATDYGTINDNPIGVYEAFQTGVSGYQIHLPDEIGVRLTAPAGYRVDEVTAISGGGNTTDVIDVTERDGAYWIEATDAASFTQNPTFTVTLEQLPTGDLTVTRFDDRYADGLFDTTKTARDGTKDEKRSFGYAYLQASDGSWYGANAGPSGDFAFRDIPVGEAKVYLGDPNAYVSAVFFDATGATTADDIERLPSRMISFSNGTFQNADGSTAPLSGPSGVPQGEATVTIDEDGEELEVGMTALRAVADVRYADGTAAAGVEVEFGSAGDWYDATEYDFRAGSYEAFAEAGGYVFHLPDELGVRLTPPAGYEISEVTAISGGGNTTDLIDVTERGGAYWVDAADASTYFANPTFTVTLEELPTATVDVTYFADVELDGVYHPGVDEALPGAQVYLQDAAGDWWATTALDGRYTFSGVAPGEATIYAQIPETDEAPEIPGVPGLELPEGAMALWDATSVTSSDDTVRAETSTISFEDGRFIDPETGETAPFRLPETLVGEVEAELTVTEVDTEVIARAADPAQQVLIGAARIIQLAAVVDLETLAPTEGLENLVFGANAYQAEAEEAAPGTGAYVATDEDGELAVFGAAEYSITPTVADGFEIVEVQAISALTGEILEVTEPAAAGDEGVSLFAAEGTYRVASEQVGGPTGAVLWAVAVAPAAVDPGTTPGVQNPGFGLPATGAAPAAASRGELAATGSESDAWSWMLLAGVLIVAGIGTRVVVRRRQA